MVITIACYAELPRWGSFPMAQKVKSLPAMQEIQELSWFGKIPWRKKWQSSLVSLPGESHGQRILVGYSPWGHKESDMTEGAILK